MTKQEFVDQVAAEERPQRSATPAKAVDAFLETITERLKSGDTVNFTGFGKFSTQSAPRARASTRGTRREGDDPGGPCRSSRRQLARVAAVVRLDRYARVKTGPSVEAPPRAARLPPAPERLADRGRCRDDPSAARRRRPSTVSRGRSSGDFADRLAEAVERKRSQLVVGLDPRARALAGRAPRRRPRARRGARRAALLLRDRRRRRAVRGRRQAAARVLRGARRRRDPRVRGGLRVRARGRAARDRRRQARRHRLDGARLRGGVPRAHGAAAARRRADREPVPRPRLARAVPRSACRRHGAGIFCLVKTSNAGSATSRT